jgi:hypothetical protein
VTPVTVKTIISQARAIPGCSGIAVYAEDVELYGDAIDDGYARALRDLLRASPGARRASAIAGGFTFVAFYVGNYVVLLKVAGRFPVLPGISIEEPSFVDPSCAPALPSQGAARREAEAALKQFGLMD